MQKVIKKLAYQARIKSQFQEITKFLI